MSFHLSYATLCILNFFSFLLSIPIIVAGVWLGRNGATACERFLDDPVMIVGILLIVVSLAGLIGVCCGVTCLLWLYLATMFVLIAIAAAFTVFVIMVTSGGSGHPLPERGYKEYRLGDYSSWFRKRVNKSEYWDNIKSCLIHTHVCSVLEISHLSYSAEEFFGERLSAVESGCCKPSDECGFSYLGPTSWTATSMSMYNNTDCLIWDNDPSRLCYDCDSCRGALVENVTVRWKKVAAVSLACLILLLIIYLIAFCAYTTTSNKSKEGLI